MHAFEAVRGRLVTNGRSRLRLTLIAVVTVVGVGLALLGYAFDVVRSLERSTVDARFSIRGAEEPPSDVLVVGIDNKTSEALPNERWPYTHDLYGRVVDRLHAAGARVIAFDQEFSEPSDTDEESYAFLDAIRRAGNVVAASPAVDRLGNGNGFKYIVPDRVLRSRRRGAVNEHLRREWRVRLGNPGFAKDPGGVVRRVPYDTLGLKSFSVVVAERALGRTISRAELGGDPAWVDYHGPPGTVRHVSFSDVLAGRFRERQLRDKIVVIGATNPVLQDVHPTSISSDDLMAGPEVQANAVSTALRGFPLRESPAWLGVALLALLGLVAPAASLRWSAVRALALAIGIAALYTVAVQLAFEEGTILPFTYPIAALVLSAVGALAVHYVTEAFERQRTREIFGRFVPRSVVGQVLEQAEGERLGGVAREATVMFSDLRGFTSFAETLEPREVITILNRYLTAMVDDAILPNGGTLVDYMGDGIMAVFGAPIELHDHADRALAAARAKLAQLDRFNEWLREEMGFDKSFRMGISLNSGRVMSGNVGSEQRLAYAAIGDTTNTAARLEAMTKDEQYTLFVADSTRARLSAEPADLVFVGEFDVRGRDQSVKVWSVGEAKKRGDSAVTFKSVSRA